MSIATPLLAQTFILQHMFGELERIAGTDDVGYEDEEDLHSVR